MIILLTFLFYCLGTIAIYQVFAALQRKLALIWLNPMLLSMFVLIPLLLATGVSFKSYYQYTQVFSYLLEPAIVALGFPLYQQMQTIKQNTKPILKSLTVAIAVLLAINVVVTMWLIGDKGVAVSLALKSITTPIALALTEDLQGIAAITAVAIIVAGVVGAIWGIRFLNLIGVTNKKAQGLAIGCGSHALGTATINSISQEHGAYSSLALIVSAVITALLGPLIISGMLGLLN